MTVVSLNDQKQTVYRETSGIKQASLGRNGQVLMLELDPTMTVFPLLLSSNSYKIMINQLVEAL